MFFILHNKSLIRSYMGYMGSTVAAYLDIIGIFGDTWRTQSSLWQSLYHLESNNYTVIPLKCTWAIQETNWLEYWLTVTWLKPWKKHISVILKQEPPHNIKKMHGFLGAVNTYWLMWFEQAHLIKVLANWFFHSFFDQFKGHIFKFGWTPLPSLLASHDKQQMTDDVCPWTRLSLGKPCHVQLPRKNAVRNVGQPANIDAMNPPKNVHEN